MTCRIIIPVQPPEEGKTRLVGALDGPARAGLIERMFRHVLAIALESTPAAQVMVVSRSALILDIATASGAMAVMEEGRGLNVALSQAAALAMDAMPVLALSADLPQLTPADILALLRAAEDADVVLATDRAGRGTNALWLRQPQLIPFAFGEASLARHRDLARNAGLRFTAIKRRGLAADIDEPDDLGLCV